jgi:hypothetical protein
MSDEVIVLRQDIATFDFLWLEQLIDAWQPQYLYQAGQVVRARNGWFAVCMRAGESGFREPLWPNAENVLVAGDFAGISIGTVEWQIRRPENASLPTIDTSTFAITPSGLTTVSSQIVQESRITRINLDGSNAVAGEYTITAEITDGLGRDHVKRTAFVLSD